MHLHRRKCHGLERVENGDARVRISRWVDDDAVHRAIGRLNGIDDRALVVGLEQLDLHARFARRCADEILQCGKIAAAVDGGLTQTEQVQVRPIDDEKFHASTSRICCTVCSGVPLLSMTASAKQAYSGSRCA